MIYNFNIRNEFGDDKNFYLSADNLNQLYRRILSQYGTTKENVIILEEYKETDSYGYELVKSHIGTPEDKAKYKKAKEIFAKNARMSEPWKSDYKQRHKVTEIPIEDEKGLYELIDKYKFIKVYWDLGEKRGVHKYFALVK